MLANDFIRSNSTYTLPENIVHADLHNDMVDLLAGNTAFQYDNLLGYLHDSIKSIDSPALEGDIFKQKNAKGQVVNKPSTSQHFRYLASTSLTINCKMMDAAFNYWLLYLSNRKYLTSETLSANIGNFTASFVDSYETMQVQLVFKNCAWSGTDGFTFKLANDSTPDEFSINLEFEDIEFSVKPYIKNQQIS